MTSNIFIIWLCLTTHPQCTVEQSVMKPIVLHSRALSCDDFDKSVVAMKKVIPVPPGHLVRNACLPGKEDM